MSDPDVEQAAEFLAAHAVLLLGLGIVVAVVVAGGIIAVVRMLRRLGPVLQPLVATIVTAARDVGILDRAISRSSLLVPSSYLALHLIFGLVVTVAIIAFVAITEEVLGGGEVVAFDLAFARALRASNSAAWEQAFEVVSWLGSVWAIGIVTALVAIVLATSGKRLLAAGWVASQAGGAVLNYALKNVFERTRPEFADAALAASSWSFPSGHAMGTFVLCGLGCYLLIRDRPSWTLAALITAVALSWCLVMGFSRLYLGVHFASDVLAGAVAGAAWVAVCASAFEVIRRRYAGSESTM